MVFSDRADHARLGGVLEVVILGDSIGDRDCYVLGDADTEQAQQPGQNDHDQDQVAEHQRGRRNLVAEPLHHAEQTLGLLSVLLGDCVYAHLGPLTSGSSSQGR